PIHFADIPGLREASCRGALLGGAGIGVSRRCGSIDAAVSYARFLCSPAYQSGEYFDNGGQPASLSAWTSAANDARAHGFFSATRASLEQAYLRPTFNGFIDYFRAAGTRIRAFLFEGGDAGSLADRLRSDYFQSEALLTD
ncbi:MAG: ABC transporter substrate-binding protein, partial [Gammaproteobacteria bacterium]|nr:ABC transporter substrate-binding protein [Gammaproteobacteria bacterium]